MPDEEESSGENSGSNRMDSVTLEKTKSMLKIHRAKQKTLYQRIQRTYDLCKSLVDQKVANQFKLLARKIPETAEQYTEIEFKINELELLLDPNFEPTFNDSFLDMVVVIEANLEAYKPAVPTSSQSKTVHKIVSEPILPKIELPNFSGKQSDWPVFYELFKSLIHDNPALSDQHKIQYLISKLSGDARNICKNLPPVAANYKVVFESLVKRYNDPRAQLTSYLDEIFKFNSLKTESRSGLASILDCFCNSITAVKRLQGVDLLDSIFLYQGLKILDPNSRREFENVCRDKELPTYTDFVNFVEKQLRSLSHDKDVSQSGKNVKISSSSKTFTVQSKAEDNFICLHCNHGSHKLTDCTSFLKLTPFERFRFVKDKLYCIKCLAKDHHSVRTCKSKLTCTLCTKNHHTLLHFEFDKQPAQPSINSENSTVSCCSTSRQHNNETTVLLATITASVFNKGRKHHVRLLLDTGSQHNFLTTKACRRLQLKTVRISECVTGFGGSQNNIKAGTSFQLSSNLKPNLSFSVQAWVIDHIIDKLPSKQVDISKLSSLKKLDLADNHFHIPGQIDGIIGAELIPDLLKGSRSNEGLGSIKIIDSVFGCVLMGKAPVSTTPRYKENGNCLLICNSSLDSLVKRFWEIEECPKSEKLLTPEENACEEHFEKTVSRLESGRFVVSLPFSRSCDSLGDSFDMAKRRLMSLERRHLQSKDLQLSYHEIMLDYLRQGHMSLARDQRDKAGYYIPHHAIVKPHSTTTPLRIVFDASAKTSTGLTLNDVLHVGPKLQTAIFSLLLNFRLFQIALTADIKQMYRQIVVDEACRRYQRILWRFSPNDPVESYDLNCVVFGIKSSPYLALRVIRKLVQEEGERFPLARDRLPSDMYMDDLITSVDSLSEAVDLYNQSKQLLKAGGFLLTKWASSSSEMLAEFSDEEKSFSSKDFESENSLAILGLNWQPSTDSFRFIVNFDNVMPTKRIILSTVARIFDPIGLLSPVILYLKCLIKELWKLQLGWDDKPPISILTRWEKCQELHLLSNIAIPRHVGVFHDSEITLIGFCDASELAYGGVIYLKAHNSHTTQLSLLCSKSRVAPSKTVSIPRLELCAALLLSELLNTAVLLLSKRCHIVKVVAFSDSTVTLHWIRSPPSRWQTFVANRVSRIQDCPITRWAYVEGVQNPADCLSRGLTPSELINHTLWWTGPSWLNMEESDWPVKIDIGTMECLPEAKVSSIVTVVQSETMSRNVIHQLIERVSNYQRLLRIMILILKVLRLLPKQHELELDTAEKYLCKVVQRIHFSKELHELRAGKECSPRLQKLSPFLDQDLIRVGGRLRNSKMDFDSCHPIVLPKDDPLVVLLIDHFHEQHCHIGPNLSLSLIRQKFWILSARSIVRDRIRKCNICFHCRPNNLTPKMGDLPPCRVSKCKPFEKCGVDYAGPINITMARRRNPFIFKSYICLFVCMATKAIHIELVSDLSTQQFLAAFRRFLSRRGPCRTIYSDCGTNFVGANEQLRQLYQFLNSKQLQNTLSSQLSDYRIEWKFIPPGSPNFGGLWEANVKSVKSHLFRVIGKQLMTYEELNTVLVQIEAVLNSRPLSPLSSDPNELQALTPAHFLTLTPLKFLPMSDVEDIPVNRLNRFELISQMVQSFWSRWRKEYLHELQVRSKWFKNTTPLQIGTVVIVDQPNLAPLNWPLGVVEELFPGTDGIIRVAIVRLAAGRLKRPVSKLYPLPTQ